MNVLEFPSNAELTFDEGNVGELVDVEMDLEEGMSRDEVSELRSESVCTRTRSWIRRWQRCGGDSGRR